MIIYYKFLINKAITIDYYQIINIAIGNYEKTTEPEPVGRDETHQKRPFILDFDQVGRHKYRSRSFDCE